MIRAWINYHGGGGTGLQGALGERKQLCPGSSRSFGQRTEPPQAQFFLGLSCPLWSPCSPQEILGEAGRRAELPPGSYRVEETEAQRGEKWAVQRSPSQEALGSSPSHGPEGRLSGQLEHKVSGSRLGPSDPWQSLWSPLPVQET